MNVKVRPFLNLLSLTQSLCLVGIFISSVAATDILRGDDNGPMATDAIPFVISQTLPVVQERGFIVEPIGCEVIAGASAPFVCSFLIENTHGTEKKLALYARSSGLWMSRVIDMQGNEIIASSAQLGSESDERAAESYITPGVPIRASVMFESVPQEGVSLIDLDFFLYGSGGSSFDVQFQPN